MAEVTEEMTPCPNCGKLVSIIALRCQFCWKSLPRESAQTSSPLATTADGGEARIGHQETSNQPPFPMIPGERVVKTLHGRLLVITTHRVRSYVDEGSRSTVTSLMLEEVASCSVRILSKSWLLIVALLVLFLSLWAATDGGKDWIVGLIITFTLAIAYALTRREVIEVGSASAMIHIDTSGTPAGSILELVDAIEFAKASRVS